MKIGKRDLQIATPDDLDARLVELTGHSAKEVRAMLDTWCPPSLLAGAILPFVKDPPSRQALAVTISKAGADEVRGEVRALLDRALTRKAGGDGKKSD